MKVTPNVLRSLAFQQVAEVQAHHPNENILVYYSKALNEYTVLPKSGLKLLLEKEPEVEFVAEFKDGVKL